MAGTGEHPAATMLGQIELFDDALAGVAMLLSWRIRRGGGNGFAYSPSQRTKTFGGGLR